MMQRENKNNCKLFYNARKQVNIYANYKRSDLYFRFYHIVMILLLLKNIIYI